MKTIGIVLVADLAASRKLTAPDGYDEGHVTLHQIGRQPQAHRAP